MSTSPEAKQAAEWTPRKVMELLGVDYQPPLPALQKVAQEHNAATAKLGEELAIVERSRDSWKSIACAAQEQLAHQQPSAPTEYGPKLPWPRGGYGAPTPDVEKWIQEIKDLFARYGSGDYTPTEHEKAVIERGLYKVLTDALAQAQELPWHDSLRSAIDAKRAALTGTEEK